MMIRFTGSEAICSPSSMSRGVQNENPIRHNFSRAALVALALAAQSGRFSRSH